MYLLDTNVVSELRKAGSGRADAHVVRWASGVAVSSLHLSVLSVYELETGVRAKERTDPAQGAALRRWLDGQVLPSFRGRILPMDVAVALRCAALSVPDRLTERDGFIAATALVHGLTVVTRHLRDFERTGATLLDPWSSTT